MGHRGFAIFSAAATLIGCWCGPAAARERVPYSFSGGTDGGGPSGGLTFDGGGDLYGTTHFGGMADCGGVTLDGGGNLYGMTSGGGTSSQGTVYEISP